MTNFEFCHASIHSKTTGSCLLLFSCTLAANHSLFWTRKVVRDHHLTSHWFLSFIKTMIRSRWTAAFLCCKFSIQAGLKPTTTLDRFSDRRNPRHSRKKKCTAIIAEDRTKPDMHRLSHWPAELLSPLVTATSLVGTAVVKMLSLTAESAELTSAILPSPDLWTKVLNTSEKRGRASADTRWMYR